MANIRFVVAVLILVSLSTAHAWDGSETGYISRIDITGGTNFGFRVWLEGNAALCTGGDAWAYLNDIDSNYKVYVSALLAAKVQRSQVRLFTTLENARCHIGYIVVF